KMRSYASGTADQPLLGETIGGCLDVTASRLPDALALVSRHQDVRLTWGQLAAEVEAVALGLLGVGVERGDRVGIWSPTCVEWTLLQLAAARVGAILVNVNPAYTVSELAYALGHSAMRMLVTAPRFKSSEYLTMVGQARGAIP